MKSKIFTVALMACFVGFASCDDDAENPYAHETSIVVSSCEIDFQPDASTGRVSFNAPGAVTATSSASWCTATVGSNVVEIAVGDNPSLEGRSAVVVLRCGGDTLQLPVTQRGVATKFGMTPFRTGNDEAHTAGCTISSNTKTLSLLDSPDWAVASLRNDSILISFTANDTRNPRFGYVRYQAGAHIDSLLVTQADYERDIMGTYTLYYRTSEDGAERPMTVTLSENQLQARTYGLTMATTYEPRDLTVNIQAGQHVGTSGDSYLFLMFGSENYWTGYSTIAYCEGKISLDEQTGQTRIEYGLNFGPEQLNRFIFERMAYSIPDSLNEYNDYGTFLQFYYPYMVKTAPSNAKETSLFATSTVSEAAPGDLWTRRD